MGGFFGVHGRRPRVAVGEALCSSLAGVKSHMRHHDGEMYMTNEEFWDIIASSKAASHGTFDGHVQSLTSYLSGLAPDEVADFQRIFAECMDRAYSWDLWGAAEIIGGFCSDDGFIDFRSWLISMGREVYEQALADPDSLADIAPGPNAAKGPFFEEFAYVAGSVHEEMTGEDIPFSPWGLLSEPTGEPWTQDINELSRRLPRLWAKYGEAYLRRGLMIDSLAAITKSEDLDSGAKREMIDRLLAIMKSEDLPKLRGAFQLFRRWESKSRPFKTEAPLEFVDAHPASISLPFPYTGRLDSRAKRDLMDRLLAVMKSKDLDSDCANSEQNADL